MVNKAISTTNSSDKIDVAKLKSTKINSKGFLTNILNGISIAIVVALIPSALVGEILKMFLPQFPQLEIIITITMFTISLMPIIAGFCVASEFGLGQIQSCSVAIAATIGSGVWSVVDGNFVLKGTGDVINLMLTIAIADLVVKLVDKRLKTYSILLMPLITIVIAGGIGLITLPYVVQVTSLIGEIISKFTLLQPVLMCALLAAAFAYIIISPISTVAIATAISLSGIGSGAANIGICVMGFSLAILGWKSNTLGTSLAHFLGSPKFQMTNLMKTPKILIPILINAGIAGSLAAIFGFVGTPMSAGFGFSGLIGPLTHLNESGAGFSTTNVLLTAFVFFVLPICLGLISRFICIDKIQLFKDEDLKIEFE